MISYDMMNALYNKVLMHHTRVCVNRESANRRNSSDLLVLRRAVFRSLAQFFYLLNAHNLVIAE